MTRLSSINISHQLSALHARITAPQHHHTLLSSSTFNRTLQPHIPSSEEDVCQTEWRCNSSRSLSTSCSKAEDTNASRFEPLFTSLASLPPHPSADLLTLIRIHTKRPPLPRQNPRPRKIPPQILPRHQSLPPLPHLSWRNPTPLPHRTHQATSS